jgi:hypothetical protein
MARSLAFLLSRSGSNSSKLPPGGWLGDKSFLSFLLCFFFLSCFSISEEEGLNRVILF